MKEKTSITLSDDLLADIDRLAGSRSRSAFIERVLRRYLKQRARAAMDAKELEKINEAAESLNNEVTDILQYQIAEE
ncbi:MAG TPA: ribbon-helix-helix domain-containing protein [Terriglobales bacterium]|nr:ribbon-helix-helix domain-containing protein [Terriglobales bacterium]